MLRNSVRTLAVFLLAAAAALGQQNEPLPSAGPKTDLHGDPLPEGAIARMGTVRLRHTEADIAYSADGKTLISAGASKDVRYWDAATGRELRRVLLRRTGGKLAHLRHPRLSSDGKRMAVWEQGDDAVCVYDTATGKELWRFPTRQAEWCWVVFSRDGKTLAMMMRWPNDQNDSFTIWDITTGKERLSKRAGRIIFGLDLSPDGRRLAWTDRQERLHLLDTTSGAEIAGLAGCVYSPRFSPDSKTLAACVGNEAKLWLVPSMEELATIVHLDVNGVGPVAFSPDGKQLAVADLDALIIWDIAARKELCRLPEKQMAHSIFSPDGKAWACTSQVGIHVWDVVKRRRLPDLPGHSESVWALAVSPDGTRVASGAMHDEKVLLWDGFTGKLVLSIPTPGSWVTACHFSGDGKRLLTGSWDGVLQLWETDTGKKLRRFEFDRVNGVGADLYYQDCAHLSADGKRLAAVGLLGFSQTGEHARLHVWDAETGKVLERRTFPVDFMAKPNPGGGSASRIGFHSRFSPDDNHVTAWTRDGLRITELLTGRELATIAGDLGQPSAFSPDGRILAAGVRKAGGDPFELDVEAVGLFETVTGKEVLRLATGAVHRIAFSRDGRFLAAIDVEGVRIWDTATGQERFRRDGPKGMTAHATWSPITSLAFLPDAKGLVTGMQDGTLLVWDMTALARSIAPPKTPLDASALGQLWDSLRGEDAQKAHQAQSAFAASPAQAVPFLREHLRPASGVDEKRVEKLIVDLDSEQFAVRDTAAKELAKLAEQIEPLLRKARETNPSLEVKRRIATQLAAPYAVPSGERLRTLRAIAVLERVGTPEAREVLRKLASGAEQARETREAKAALERFAR